MGRLAAFPEEELPVSNGPMPSSDLRQFAYSLRQMYVALIQEGFTTNETFAIIGEVIRGSFGSQA